MNTQQGRVQICCQTVVDDSLAPKIDPPINITKYPILAIDYVQCGMSVKIKWKDLPHCLGKFLFVHRFLIKKFSEIYFAK
jgi:hypothetical protein